MNALAAIVVMAALAPDVPRHHGVIVPNGGFGERSQLVLQAGVYDISGSTDTFAQYAASQLPASDRARWWVILYVNQLECQASKQLVRDFGNHKGLVTLGQWAKLFIIDKYVSPAAEARHAAALAKDHAGVLPAILVVANPDDPTFGTKSPQGWHYAFQRAGYGGDANLLARYVYEAIRKQYIERGVKDCPGPYCPVDPQPDRQPYPSPNPSPYQPVNPRQPNVFPPTVPMPRPMDEPQTPQDSKPVPEEWKLPFTKWELRLYVVGAILLWIAYKKGWLQEVVKTTKTKAKLLLLALCLCATPALAADAPVETPRGPADAAEAKVQAAPASPPCLDPRTASPVGVEAYYPDGYCPENGPRGPFSPEEAYTRLVIIDQVKKLIAGVVWAVKVLVFAMFSLAITNLAVNVAILYYVSRRKTP